MQFILYNMFSTLSSKSLQFSELNEVHFSLDKRYRFVFPRVPPQRASEQFRHLFLEYLRL